MSHFRIKRSGVPMLQSLWIKICKRRRQGFRRENKQFGFTVGDDEEANPNDPLATVNRSQTIRIFKQNSRPAGDLRPSDQPAITDFLLQRLLCSLCTGNPSVHCRHNKSGNPAAAKSCLISQVACDVAGGIKSRNRGACCRHDLRLLVDF